MSTAPKLTHAKQGRPYLLDQDKVIALESGITVKVLHFNAECPWAMNIKRVAADLLTPLPSKYLRGAMS